MSDKHFCPRAVENGGGPDSPFKPPFNGEATWREDGTCSYCGSLSGDTFMARLEAGDVEVIPTDKSYKAYLRNISGETFKQTYRDCPKDATCAGPDDCTHWVTRDHDQPKFYFQHLSGEQKDRFIALHNEKRMKFAVPGHFYVRPFFCQAA